MTGKYILKPIDYDFMKKAQEVATESGCIRSLSRFGAVAVRDDKILSVGWNGHVGAIPSCLASGKCIRKELNIPSGTHREVGHCICAEQRLICVAAKDGIALNGATMYVTGLPCEVCVRLIIAAGFLRVIYLDTYANDKSYEMAQLGGLELVKLTSI